MVRRMLTAALVTVVLATTATAVGAQPRPGSRGPVFRVEPETRSEHVRQSFVTGWIYNDGQGVVGLVRMKVEILDAAGTVIGEHVGWAYGNVTPGGRAYFMIPIPVQSPPDRRVSVESWVIQSYGPESP